MLPIRGKSSAPQCDCGRQYGTVTDAGKKLGWRYRCKPCGSTKSALTDIWFQGSHLSFYQHLKLLLCYISGCTAKQIMKFTKIQAEAVTQWTVYAKEVMQVVLSNDSEKIGGVGKVVEIDELSSFEESTTEEDALLQRNVTSGSL